MVELNGFSYSVYRKASENELLIAEKRTLLLYNEFFKLVETRITLSVNVRLFAIVVVQILELVGDRVIDSERHTLFVSIIVFYYDDIVFGCVGIHDINIKEDVRASHHEHISDAFGAQLVELNGFSDFVYRKARENELRKALNRTLLLYNEVFKLVETRITLCDNVRLCAIVVVQILELVGDRAFDIKNHVESLIFIVF